MLQEPVVLPPLITDFLDQLTAEERDRVMTQEMTPEADCYGFQSGCLIFVAAGMAGQRLPCRSESTYDFWNRRLPVMPDCSEPSLHVGIEYDSLCFHRYGVQATNAAIREYLVTHPLAVEETKEPVEAQMV